MAKPAGQHGYPWKTLFLPEGTQLRIASHRGCDYAVVEGDELVHNALTATPNQFARACLGGSRSAWEAIYVRLPGERQWKQALHLRHASEAAARRAGQRLAGEGPAATAVAAPLEPRPVRRHVEIGRATPCGDGEPWSAARVPPADRFAPPLRAEHEERRQVYRRAEDLLQD